VNSSQCVGGLEQQWECWLSADCKQYAVTITFSAQVVQMYVVQLLLFVVKCVKCRVGLLFFIALCVPTCTVVH